MKTDMLKKHMPLLTENCFYIDMEFNAQALINTSRVRLCYQASNETREKWKEIKFGLKQIGQEELSDCLVPNCIYRCGCPEFKACGYFDGFKNWAVHHGYDMNDIRERYDAYNKYFYDQMDLNRET